MGAPFNNKPSTTHSIGNEVRQGLEIAGTLKGMYNIGHTVFRGVQFAAPIIAGLVL